MSQERTYYVICEDNCKFESMTKEQILAAIAQATGETEGSIDVDEAFITKVKEMNANAELKFWVGTEAQYNALTTVSDSTLYLITDQTQEDLEALLTDLSNRIDECNSSVNAFNTKVNIFENHLDEIEERTEKLESNKYSKLKSLIPNVTGDGDTYCVYFAEIQITKPYADSPIVIEVGRRGDNAVTTLYVRALNDPDPATTCQSFLMDGITNNTDWTLVDDHNGNFKLYCTSNTWGESGVIDVRMSKEQAGKCEVTLHNERIASMPSGGMIPARKGAYSMVIPKRTGEEAVHNVLNDDIYVQRLGNIVQIDYDGLLTTQNQTITVADYTVGTLEPEFRPERKITSIIVGLNGGTMYKTELTINTTGEVSFTPPIQPMHLCLHLNWFKGVYS